MLITNTGCGVEYFCLFYFSLLFLWFPHIFLKKEKNLRMFWNTLLIVLSLLWLLLHIYCKLIINCLGKFTSESNYSNWFNENSCSLVLCSERMKSPSAEFCGWCRFSNLTKNALSWVISKSEVSDMEMKKRTSSLLTLDILLGSLSVLFDDFFNSV